MFINRTSYAPDASTVLSIADKAEKQGISSRFLSFLSQIDHKAGERVVGEGQTLSSRLQDQAHTAYVKTREADQQHGVSNRFYSYYSKALATPIGQR